MQSKLKKYGRRATIMLAVSSTICTVMILVVGRLITDTITEIYGE